MRTRLSLLLLFGCLWPLAAQAQQPVTIVGQKTPNASAPTALRNLPVMPAIACSTGQSYTAGRVVFPCTNLFGYSGIFLTDPNTGAIVTLATDPTHDAPAATSGPQVMAECDDTATDGVDEGDASRLRSNCTTRALMVETLDPCQHNTKSFVAINGTADATIITGTASKKIYVCSINLVSATAQNLNILSGTGTTCQTGTTAILGLSGGATAATGWNFAANSGIAFGSGGFAIAQVQNNADNLCMDTSSTGQYSGGISYVVQ